MGFPDELPEPEETDEFSTTFIPWFVFNWIPYDDRDSRGSTYPKQQLALAYLADSRNKLSSFEQQFIETLCDSPYSFFAVSDVVPGVSLTLEDLFLEETHVVKERQGALPAVKGRIFYSRVATMDNTSIMIGAAPVTMDAAYRLKFIDLREEFKKEFGNLTKQFLVDADVELRRLYFDFKQMMLNPPIPQMRNTDGDPFELTKLHFDLTCTPREAFDSLKPLRLDIPDEDVLQDAVFDADGALQKVFFDWLKKGNKMHGSWDNTIMGKCHIDGATLTIEVNSRRRAEKIKALVQKYLKQKAVYKTSVIQSVESIYRDVQERGPLLHNQKAASRRKELEESPEFQAQIREIADQHWEEWLDSKIPALGNISPRQAAKTKIGREKLEALLLSYESHAKDGKNLFAPDVNRLKEKLGLA